MKTILGLLAAATCVPVIAIAATMGTGGDISLQFEPPSRRARSGAISVRVPGAAGEVELDPSNGLSSRSPMGACASANGSSNASGDCRDSLLVTGGGNNAPLDLNDWESDNEGEIWPETLPGESDEELVISAFVPDDPESVAGPDDEKLTSPSDIVGADVGEVPEPSTMLLMGGGLLALGYFRKKRNS